MTAESRQADRLPAVSPGEAATPILLIVPTLDSHRLLPRLVASLQAQTYPHWRVLFIDAASGADHRDWLERLCADDARFLWCLQEPQEAGIFGAMNQGFRRAGSQDWLLFWGSDDWAASPTVLEEAAVRLEACGQAGETPDLLVCRGRYQRLRDGAEPEPGRASVFRWRQSFRRSLLLGSTPPHQATLFGPGSRRRLSRYAPGFSLSADLDHFLQLSACEGLRVEVCSLELVHMGDGGVSGRRTRRRLWEVAKAYGRAFGIVFWFPYLLRYGQRLVSRLERGRPPR